MDAIASCAGTEGMIGASCRFNFRRSPSRFRYYKFYSQKQTAAMIESSLKAGAILGQASKREIEALANLGYCIGMAFQIQDDILDITGDEKELGKAINSDLKNNKATFVSIKGLEESKKYVERLTRQGMDYLEILKERGNFLIWLSDYLMTRGFEEDLFCKVFKEYSIIILLRLPF